MPKTPEQFFHMVQDRAWALHPAKLEEVAVFIERRLSGEQLAQAQGAAGKSGNRAEETYEVRQGVAILPLYGVLDKRMNLMLRFSGGTSTELFARDFRKALDDPRVEAILLDIDSPGGAVDGTKELADLVYGSRGQKPIIAYANGLMASAAYWIGSAADQIVAMDTAEVGSIGVALMHYDYSVQDDQLGIKRTAITAGKYKRIAGDEKPLSPEGQEYLQGMVDDYYGLFLEAVGRHRGVEPETVHDRMADGRIFIGKKAKKVKLVDAIGNFNEALALARQEGGKMPKNLTKEQLLAENPDLYREILAEGATGVSLADLLAADPQAAEKLRAEGRDQERARVVEIMEMEGPANLTLTAVKAGQEPKEAIKAFWAARDQLKAQALDNLQAAAAPSVGQAAAETVIDTSLPVEERAKAEWDQDPQLRREFPEFSAYLAFAKAQAAGLVKIKGKS